MENLGIDSKLLLAQLINFVLFFYLFRKYIAGPFTKFFNQEKSKEKEKEQILIEVQKKEEQAIKREEEAKKKQKVQYDLLITKAKEDAKLVREEIVANARKEADQIITKSRKQLEEEKLSLYADAKKKIADVSIFLVNNALKEYLDEQTKKKITSIILKNLSKTTLVHDN